MNTTLTIIGIVAIVFAVGVVVMRARARVRAIRRTVDEMRNVLTEMGAAAARGETFEMPDPDDVPDSPDAWRKNFKQLDEGESHDDPRP